MPETAGNAARLETDGECEAVRSAITSSPGNSSQLVELRQPSAADVLQEVHDGSVDILHMACHAEPNLSNPADTALLFGQDPQAPSPEALSVSDLRAYRNPDGAPTRAPRLAYLSACCTAQQYDVRLTDESIHLAAACQLCGFPSTIGKLWEADDRAAVVVAEGFYKELFWLDGVIDDGKKKKKQKNVAQALHVAVAACREMKLGRGDAGQDALLWAGFVHIGA
jgi:CHAT domain-containing protein